MSAFANLSVNIDNLANEKNFLSNHPLNFTKNKTDNIMVYWIKNIKLP